MDQSASHESTKPNKDQGPLPLDYCFHKLSSSSLPNLPPPFQTNICTKSLTRAQKKGSDKMQVFIQLLPCSESNSCVSLDPHNNTFTISDPAPPRKINGSTFSKSFPAESVIDKDCPIIDICCEVLKTVIRTVAGGEDACVLSLGNASSTDPNVMLGSDKSPKTLGIIPCAILWLFNYIEVIRKAESSRFSVRISAIELSESNPSWRDLLSKLLNSSDDSHVSGRAAQLKTPMELRAKDIGRAYYYLDFALTERSKFESCTCSHTLLTLHLYQYHTENDSGINGGCSRLHLIDLGQRRVSEDRSIVSPSVQDISKVITAIWGDQGYIPNSESHLTELLRRFVIRNNERIQTSMIFNISCKKVQYHDVLHLLQLASKIFRQENVYSKLPSSIHLDHYLTPDSFSFRRIKKTREGVDSEISDAASVSSEMDATSNSDVSCTTVIFRDQRVDNPRSIQRGMADGSSNNQIKNLILDTQEEKSCVKLSKSRHTRRGSVRTSSRFCVKTVKKGLQGIKPGRELWVDGPRAFCAHDTSMEMSGKEAISVKNEDLLIHEGLNVTRTAKVQTSLLSKARFFEIPLEADDREGNLKKMTAQNGDNDTIKLTMVSNWLSKQPPTSENVIQDSFSSGISRKYECKQLENDKLYTDNSVIIPYSKMRSAHLDDKTSSKNHSRIEEWMRKVMLDSSKNGPYPNESEVPISQSPSNQTCLSKYQTSQTLNQNSHPFIHTKQNTNPQLAPDESLPSRLLEKRDNSSPSKPLNESKRNQKDGRKKDAKKVFGFFNQLIRNRKTKKEIPNNRQQKKQYDEQLEDSTDFTKWNELNIVTTPPHHINTCSGTLSTKVVSSGQGSNCCSFNGIKMAETATDIRQKGSNFEVAPSHRTASSGYQSIVRDSELSSHNDSTSDCSTPSNVLLCIPTAPKTSVNPTKCLDSVTPSLSTFASDKRVNKCHIPERQLPIVSDLIRSEKMHSLETEREEIINDLIETMVFYNMDEHTIRKDVEKIINEVRVGDYSTESLRSTNQTLRSVLNHYRSNICMVTCFLSKVGSEVMCE